MKSKLSSPRITGKTLDELSKSTELAIQQIWKKVNDLVDETGKKSIGDRKAEPESKGIRLVQTKDEYFLEARFEDGWARLTTSFQLLTKKD